MCQQQVLLLCTQAGFLLISPADVKAGWIGVDSSCWADCLLPQKGSISLQPAEHL